MSKNRQAIIHAHSNVYTNGVAKAPTSGLLEKGEIAVNYNDTEPSLFIENNSGDLVQFVSRDYIDNGLAGKSDTSHTHSQYALTSGTYNDMSVGSATTAGDANTVNGHTVETNVPSGAVFTDSKVTGVANHYTATTATKTGGTTTSTASSAIKGITYDNAGHIVGITSGSVLTSHATHAINVTNGTASATSGSITFVESVASAGTATSGNPQISTVRKTVTIPDAVTEDTVAGWGFTKNEGTITGVNMNGASKGTSGVVDLGTVITSETQLSTASTGTGNAITDLTVSNHKITMVKGLTFLTGETDPVFSASAAAGISSTDITNWNSKADSGHTHPIYENQNALGKVSDGTNTYTATATTDTLKIQGSGNTTVSVNATNGQVTISSAAGSDTATTETGHYSPSTAAATGGSATAGSFLKTIALDSKGHYISASTGTAITSLPTASTVTNDSSKIPTNAAVYTALQGKLGTGDTAADSSKLGGVAAANYAQTGGTYSGMTVGSATSAGNASTVSNHTVESDVPSGAVFTDTATTQTGHYSGGAAASTAGTSTAGSFLKTVAFDNKGHYVSASTGTAITSETQLSTASTGTGNAITNLTVSNHKITFEKGATYTTSGDVQTMIEEQVSSSVNYKGATATLPTASAKVGDMYIATADIAVPSGKSATSGATTAEKGDYIIARNSGTTYVWDVVEKNITGAVTSTDTLGADNLVVGNGSQTVKTTSVPLSSVALTSGTYANMSVGSATTASNAATADDAGTVNGHTVAADVPSGAVFTDTATTQTGHYSGGAAASTAGTSTAGSFLKTVAFDNKGHYVSASTGTAITSHATHAINVTNGTASATSGSITFVESVASAGTATSGNPQISTVRKTVTIPDAVTENTVAGWGFTKNEGTITGINMNGASKGTSGVVDLGTVITSETQLSTASTGTGNAVTNITVSDHQITMVKGASFSETDHKHSGADITSGTVGAAYLPTATTSGYGITTLGTSAGTAAEGNHTHTEYALTGEVQTYSTGTTTYEGGVITYDYGNDNPKEGDVSFVADSVQSAITSFPAFIEDYDGILAVRVKMTSSGASMGQMYIYTDDGQQSIVYSIYGNGDGTFGIENANYSTIYTFSNVGDTYIMNLPYNGDMGEYCLYFTNDTAITSNFEFSVVIPGGGFVYTNHQWKKFSVPTDDEKVFRVDARHGRYQSYEYVNCDISVADIQKAAEIDLKTVIMVLENQDGTVNELTLTNSRYEFYDGDYYHSDGVLFVSAPMPVFEGYADPESFNVVAVIMYPDGGSDSKVYRNILYGGGSGSEFDPYGNYPNLTAGTATNASTVNNHTVNSNVPANAVFTDNSTTQAGHYDPSATGAQTYGESGKYLETLKVDSKGHLAGYTTAVFVNTDSATTETGHYAPSTAAATAGTATAGTFLKTIALDSKGHYISATTATAIQSLPTASTVVNDSTTIPTNAAVYNALTGKMDTNALLPVSRLDYDAPLYANETLSALTINYKNGDASTGTATFNGSANTTVNISSLTVSSVSAFTPSMTDTGVIYAVSGASRSGVNYVSGAANITIPTTKDVVCVTGITADRTVSMGSGMSDGQSIHVIFKSNSDATARTLTLNSTFTVLTESDTITTSISNGYAEMNILFVNGQYLVRAM